MRKALALLLSACMLSATAAAQTATPAQTAQPQQQADDEVIRITSALVQTDVVVADKNDRIVEDLKLSDFEIYENGKRQDVKFMEFINLAGDRRTEGTRPGGGLPETARIERDLTARDVRRVVAFVVDDLTIPYQDMIMVRQTLRDFVENKMEQGDLVAIVRTVGGKGLLQQFTADKQLLRRAISQLNATASQYAAFNNPEQTGLTKADLTPLEAGGMSEQIERLVIGEINNELSRGVADETTRLTRGLIGLSTANSVIDSLREIPGRKSLVLFSGGVPVLKSGTIETDAGPVGVVGGASGGLYNNINVALNRLRDNAVRSGVVINTMDPRGLGAQRGVAGFQDTPGQSALGSGNPGFGRGVSDLEQRIVGAPLSAGSEQLSLRALSDSTGGVSVINTNDFKEGLDRVLAHTRGYYVLAYTPTERFDNKFRKLDVKVKRDGLRVFKHTGYFAREEAPKDAPKTKEEQVIAAVRSPLARRELDISSNLSLRMMPPKGGDLGINLLIDPKSLNFAQADGKYTTKLDVVGFVYDELGKLRGGFSETVNVGLTPENYQEALKTGLSYSAGTQLPPGYYQLKAVVREEGSGNVGSISRYVEVPDLNRGRLTMSSIFLHAVDPAGAAAAAAAQPLPLIAVRRLPRSRDLRYSAIVYNAKQSGGKSQLVAQTIISRNDKVIFRGPEHPAVPRTADPAQVAVVEQIGLPKVAPGRYVLTLVITDTLADKKTQTVTRSIDFEVVD